MKQIELYDANELLKGATYDYVLLFPTRDGKVQLLSNKAEKIIFEKLAENYNYSVAYGFMRSRTAIRSIMPGCDRYALLKPSNKNEEIRRKMALNRTTISIDENGIGTITDKKYFVLYSKGLTKREQRTFKNHSLVYVKSVDNGDSNSCELRFIDSDSLTKSAKKELSDGLGYLLTLSDIQKIEEDNMANVLLSEDNFDVVVQDENGFHKKTYEEIKSLAVPYYTFNEATKRDILIYEYDVLCELPPSFGQPMEMEKVGITDNQLPVWFVSADIVRNGFSLKYVSNIKNKGNRTFVIIPDGKSEDIITALSNAGKINQVSEVTMYYNLGKSYIVPKVPSKQDNIPHQSKM